jgi:DNA-binding PadR family transcriptional regulator
MDPEEIIEEYVLPVLVFCAKTRVRDLDALHDLIMDLLQSMENRGIIDIADETEVYQLLEHGLVEAQRVADDLDPPLTVSQVRALMDLHAQLRNKTFTY